MRETYHAELDQLVKGLVGLTELVGASIERATTALLEVDMALADRVIADDAVIARTHRELDEHALVLLARQQPVATDLRIIVASLRMTADLERMSHLARHVAEVARQRYPDAAVPAELRTTVIRMSRVAARITAKAGAAIEVRNPRAELELERDDDEMDRLQESLYRRLVLDGGLSYSTQIGLDVALIGRYYERYADHAVSLARRIGYMAGTGPLHGVVDSSV